jgi:hypothetical protein
MTNHRRIACAWFTFASMAALPALAKDLFVDRVRGNDAVKYADNSSAKPWASIGRAAWGSDDRGDPDASQAARAGDVVLVAAGTYPVDGTDSRNVPAYNPVNEGSPGKPIIFRAQGLVKLTLSSSIGTVFGSFDRDHIIWDGFTVHENTAPSHPDTGAVTIWACDGCAILNSHINGGGDARGRQDNHTGIRIEGAKNIVIRGNRIENVYTAHNTLNGAGIQTYDAGFVTIEYNDISKSGSGIFLKGNDDPRWLGSFDIRFNRIHDIGEMRGGYPAGAALALLINPSPPEHPVRIYQNVIERGTQCVRLWALDPRSRVAGMLNVRLFNNTFAGCETGMTINNPIISDARHVIWNNIFTKLERAVFFTLADTANLSEDRIDIEHNLYFEYPAEQFALIDTEGNNPGMYSLNSWRRAFRQHDNVAPVSMNKDPKFVDGAAGDYRLKPDSAALKLGVDMLDLDKDGDRTEIIPAGAYITGNEKIGLPKP